MPSGRLRIKAMPSTPLLSLASEVLRSRAGERLRSHWVLPRPAQAAPRLAAEDADKTARAVLDAMLTRPFRVGPLPPEEVYEQLLSRVARCVARSRPVSVTIGYGPLKNPLAVAESRAEWAEFFALCHLVHWHNKVQAIYPPGLMLNIAFDDATLTLANR